MAGDMTRMGALLSILEVPCLPAPQVWIAYAGRPITHWVISFLEPNWKTLFKIAAKKSWLCGLKQLAHDGHETTFTPASTAFTAMTELAEVVDKAAWFYWIASITAEAVVEWSSAVIRATRCGDPSLTALMNRPAWAASGSGWAIPLWVPVVDPMGWDDSRSYNVPPGRSATFAWSLRLEPFLGQPFAPSVRLVDANSGTVYHTDHWAIASGPDYWFVHHMHVPDNHLGDIRRMQVQFQPGPDDTYYAECYEGNFTCIADPVVA
jgi:hypothetical protein